MFQSPNQIAAVSPLVERPSLETVKTAIKCVLNQDASVDRKEASDFIEALKCSVFAWEICDQLLQARESIEVSYLAAHMLRQKISKNFTELPQECYSSLKDSILNHLQSIEDYAVQGQLTMAISDLTLLLQCWQNPVEDLAKQLGLDVNLLSLVNVESTAIIKALHNRLIFAYIIHQMCDLNHNNSERPCRIGARRREEYEEYLISKCSQVISWWLTTIGEVEDLKSQLQAQTVKDDNDGVKKKCVDLLDKLVGQIYLSYSAWLRVFDEENVNESSPILDSAFHHLGDRNCPDSIHKYAVEVVVATANYCQDNNDLLYIVDNLVEDVFTIEPAFKQSVTDEDIAKSSDFARAFASVADIACTSHIIEQRDYRLLDLMLSCLTHYDHDVIEEIYPFWWTFLESMQNRLTSTELNQFIPYVNRFVMAVTNLCQFDPDEDSVVSQDRDIFSFRVNTAEIIINVMFVTTVDVFIRDMGLLDSLRVDLSKISWEKVESVLYLLSCLTQMMTRTENHLRMEIFNCIISQQTNCLDLATKQVSIQIGTAPGQVHPQIVATSLRIIGSLDNFLSDSPDHLVLAINYILSCTSNELYRNQLISNAAIALSGIMELNANRHLSSCPQLLVVIKDLCLGLDQYDDHASSQLLRCSALMADAITDNSIKDQFLCQIIEPIMNSLKTTLIPPKKDETEPTKYLDRMSCIFRQANIPHSSLDEMKNFAHLVDKELWPVIVKVLEVYASERGHAIERTCRTIRYIIRCLKPEWMIERVAETMVKLYTSYPQNSSPLYICSILVDEFANRSLEINQGLFNMLEIFCSLTFQLLEMKTNSPSKSLLNMKNYPETIDDMMRLFNRFMIKCPQDFVNCKALESIIELSISSLRIDHQDANTNVSKFLNNFISLGLDTKYPHISKAIREVLGARITDTVIRACFFDIPTQLIAEEAQILLTLSSFDRNLFNTWIEATIQTLPKTNIQGIESVTTDQLEDFKYAITHAGSLKKLVNCLRAFSRMYV